MSDETEEPIKPRWTDLIGIDPDYLKDASYRLTPDEMDISWAGLMELLDEHWPADLFPTLEDDPERDTGARIVSLLRWVDRLRRAQAPIVLGDRLGSVDPATVLEYVEDAPIWIDHTRYRDNPDNRPRMGEDANQFLARMFEQTKHAPITNPNPDSSKFGAKAAVRRFIARGRFKR